MIKQRLFSLAMGGNATGGAVLLACSLVLPGVAAAQTGPTVTIRILDGRTGEAINPSNLLIRVDHKDELHNMGLKLNGIEPATAELPAGATELSVQGTFNASMDIYINCDADTGKSEGPLKWYSIADILKTGVVAPNHCYKGKYAGKIHVEAKPGEFVFFVRTHSWRDVMSY